MVDSFVVVSSALSVFIVVNPVYGVMWLIVNFVSGVLIVVFVVSVDLCQFIVLLWMILGISVVSIFVVVVMIGV